MALDHLAMDVVHYHSHRRPDHPAIEDLATQTDLPITF